MTSKPNQPQSNVMATICYIISSHSPCLFCSFNEVGWGQLISLGRGIFVLFNDSVRGMRERSPPLPKITHPSFPRLGKSQASTGRSAMPQSPPEGTACMITVSPVPGKLTWLSRAFAYIPRLCSKHLWVSYSL